jgi:excisionase family DNA binding protein
MEVGVLEASRILGVHRNTIYNLIRRRRVVARKSSHGWRISRSSLEGRLKDKEPPRDGISSLYQACRAIEMAMEGYGVPMGMMATMQMDDHYCLCRRLIVSNRAFADKFGGIETDRPHSWCWHQNMHPDDREIIMADNEMKYVDSERYQLNFRLRNVDEVKEYTWVEAKGILCRPGEISSLLINIFEIQEILE